MGGEALPLRRRRFLMLAHCFPPEHIIESLALYSAAPTVDEDSTVSMIYIVMNFSH
jgi:hypothetical protein